jgi:hypothetical protein
VKERALELGARDLVAHILTMHGCVPRVSYFCCVRRPRDCVHNEVDMHNWDALVYVYRPQTLLNALVPMHRTGQCRIARPEHTHLHLRLLLASRTTAFLLTPLTHASLSHSPPPRPLTS